MSDLKKFTRKEVQEKSCPKENPITIIYNDVIDLKNFLDDHPGGHEVLLKVVGKDASEEFDDIGHSDTAREMKQQYRVGELVDADKNTAYKPGPTWKLPPASSTQMKQPVGEDFTGTWQFKVAVGIVLLLIYTYVF